MRGSGLGNFHSDRQGLQGAMQRTLAETTADRIRERVVSGILVPGSHLPEQALCDELAVSRNTLREVFRLLTREGLLRHEANRGVFVAIPDMSTIIDIYRVRRHIECPALANGHPHHPATRKMRLAVESAREYGLSGDWLGAGSADIAFHAAIVELADSPRLSAFYAQISLELRLVFGLLRDPEYLHAPYIGRNAAILALFESGAAGDAASALEDYLVQAERFILAAYSRITAERQDDLR